MEIVLRNFKYASLESLGTLSFTATVYVDGNRMFEVSDNGSGGSVRFDLCKGVTNEDLKQVEQWVIEQPKVHLMDDMDTEDSLEFLIHRLADREVVKRRLKPKLKRQVVFFDPHPGTGGLLELPTSFNPSNLTDMHRQSINKLHPDCLILNDLDFEQSVDMFTAASNASGKLLLKAYEEIKSAQKIAAA